MEIKKIHQFFLFVFSMSGLIFYLLLKNNIIIDNLNLLLFCFFMILILGVSHGALDHWRGKKIFHPLLKKKWSVVFYPGYVLLSLMVIFVWILFPVMALLLFLLVASYHFGEEDLRFFIKGKGYLFNLVCFFKGLLIITLSFHYNHETTAIFFEYLMVSSIQYEELTKFKSLLFSINLIFVVIGLVFLLRKQIDKLVLILFEIIFITLAFIYLPLILAFSMYFCFLHSSKHIIGLALELDSKKIMTLLDSQSIVLISPMGYSPSGQAFNLAAEELAADVSVAIAADKLIMLDTLNHLANLEGLRESTVTPTSLEALMSADEAIAPLSRLRLATMARAVRGGVAKAHIISFEKDGGLLQELFTAGGVGTQVLEENTGPVRAAKREDVSDIVEIIRPLEESGVLVRRSRDRLEQEIDHF